MLLNASVPQKSDYAVFTPLCFMELTAQSFISLVSLDYTPSVVFFFAFLAIAAKERGGEKDN